MHRHTHMCMCVCVCFRKTGFIGKESACNAGDPGSNPEWGRSPGEGNGNPHSSILPWEIP